MIEILATLDEVSEELEYLGETELASDVDETAVELQETPSE